MFGIGLGFQMNCHTISTSIFPAVLVYLHLPLKCLRIFNRHVPSRKNSAGLSGVRAVDEEILKLLNELLKAWPWRSSVYFLCFGTKRRLHHGGCAPRFRAVFSPAQISPCIPPCCDSNPTGCSGCIALCTV